MGVCIGAITATIVLVINITFLAWITRTFPYEGSGIYTLVSGAKGESCSATKRWSTWLHLTINVFGTILLGASNYYMQVLSSPTRQEVNKAHSHKKWLDIGVPSVVNLFSIERKRIVIWVLLAFSSIPLHLV